VENLVSIFLMKNHRKIPHLEKTTKHYRRRGKLAKAILASQAVNGKEKQTTTPGFNRSDR